MPWTFEQRMERATEALINQSVLEKSQVEKLRRPLFFGKWAIGVGLSLNLKFWGDWFEVKDDLSRLLESSDHGIQSNRRTYQFNAFSSDPSVVKILAKAHDRFSLNHVRIVDRSCWNLALPRPRPKAKFYGEYGWRFEFKDPLWHSHEGHLSLLDGLSGDIKLVTTPRTFLYLKNLSDVLLFKLIAAEQLLSLEDRHTL